MFIDKPLFYNGRWVPYCQIAGKFVLPSNKFLFRAVYVSPMDLDRAQAFLDAPPKKD
jgi:hypothetical protein